jgi:AcrR family transcriptional regulator
MDGPATRTRILDAAVTVYGREGARGFSMRAVASETGITATAIYRHYPDKAALAAALVDRARRMLGGYLVDGMRGENSLVRVWSCSDSYVRFVRQHPQLYRLLFLEPLHDTLPGVHEIGTREEAAPFLFVVDRIREAMDDGYLVRDDPTRTALSVWAHLHGLCALFLAGRVTDEDLAPVARASLKHLYEGLRRRDDDAE